MMKFAPPDFSIIIPAYNRSGFLQKNLPVLLKLDHESYEVIVVNDGSTDETLQVLENIQDPKLRFLTIPNSERGKARNIGAKAARGSYLTFLDSDDLLYSFALGTALSLIRKNNDPEFLHLAYHIRKPDGNKTRVDHGKDPVKKLLKGNYFSCIGVFLRRDIALAYPFCEIRDLSGSEDWLLWLKLASRFSPVTSNTPCGVLIEHENRSVYKFDERMLLERARLLNVELRRDPVFVREFSSEINKIYGHMLTYTALHAAMAGKKRKVVKYFFKGICLNYRELFTRRTLGILKNMI